MPMRDFLGLDTSMPILVPMNISDVGTHNVTYVPATCSRYLLKIFFFKRWPTRIC